jgi:flagellar basal-body rod modification protein FlgD
MSTINPTPSSTTVGGTAAGANPQPGGALGETQFLQLMMDQMKAQDPLNPSDPTQFLSELAQFTSLEQTTNIATSSAAAARSQSTAAALALLGHTVTYVPSSGGAAVTGTVQKVDFSSSGPTLTVNGVSGVNPSSVGEVS